MAASPSVKATVRNIETDDGAEIAPERRARAFPFLPGMQQRKSDVGGQDQDEERHRVERGGIHATCPSRVHAESSSWKVAHCWPSGAGLLTDERLLSCFSIPFPLRQFRSACSKTLIS
jgi:hypothetical protein